MRLPVLICSLFFLFCAAQAGLAPPAFGVPKEWVLIDENDNSTFYYDQGATVSPKRGVLRVLARVIYTKRGKTEALKTLARAKGLEKLYQSNYLYDVDCDEMQSKLLEVTHQDKGGATLQTTNLTLFTEWEEVSPDTRLGLTADLACRTWFPPTGPSSGPPAGTPAAAAGR